MVLEKYAILTCVSKLSDIGYPLRTLSSLLIQAKDLNMEHDVHELGHTLAQNYRHNMVNCFILLVLKFHDFRLMI